MEQTLTDQPRNCCSSSQKSRIFCIRTQDTEDVENLHPIINESKLKPYHHPVFPQQQETLLTLIAPSQESTTQEVEKTLDSRRRYNTSLTGKDNPLKNQCGRIGERSSEEQLDYAKSSTGAILMPLESPTIRIPGKLYNEVVVRMCPFEKCDRTRIT